MQTDIMQGFFEMVNYKVLIAFNLAIIIVTELSGRYFFDHGLIHGVAIFFIGFSLLALYHRPINDTFLNRFLYQAPTLALFLFAVAHGFEFVTDALGINLLPGDGVIVNVLNLHIAGLLVIVSAAWYVLLVYQGEKTRLAPLIVGGLAIAAILFSFYLFISGVDISLSPSGGIPYIYTVGAVVMIMTGLLVFLKIWDMVPILKNYMQYFMYSFLLIAVAALMIIFQGAIETKLGVPQYQLAYISHFILYASLSFLFLISQRFGTVSPLYKDLEEFERTHPDFLKKA